MPEFLPNSEQFEKTKCCKISATQIPKSKAVNISQSVLINETTDSEENNFQTDRNAILKPISQKNYKKLKADTPYYFDRDEIIEKTLNDFYKHGILPVIKILKNELSCHHARFIELMIKLTFTKDMKSSKQLIDLLPNLLTAMIIQHSDIVIGLDKITQNIDSIELDNPNASLKTLHLIRFLIDRGVLYETYLEMLPYVFYECVTRNYNLVQLTLMRFKAFERENEAQQTSELMEVPDSASKDDDYFSELLNIDPEKINELAVYSLSYDEEIKEYLKELLIYREICQEVIDVLYRNNDVEYILQFFEEIKRRYLTHEFLQLYIQRSIFRSIIYVMRVSRTLEELMHIIPKSVMEMTFMRLLGTVPRNCAESTEAQDLFCIFLARSIVDGIVSASYIRKINRVQIGGILGVELIDKTIKWVKFNKNIHRAKEGSKLVIQFPMEIVLMRRVKILGLITHILRTGQVSQFPRRLHEIDTLNIDGVFTVRTLLKKFLTRGNGLVSQVTEIITVLVQKKLIERKLIGYMVKDLAKVLHQIEGYGFHSDRNLSILKQSLAEKGLF